MIIWIIGLSGAGKTTLANEVVRLVREKGKNVVLLDGDMIRELYENDLGHCLKDRRKNADRICRLCQFLDTQKINVVCSILSIFPESREWCRNNLRNYYEVFIDCPLSDLRYRDVKGLYKKYDQGLVKDVAGLDLEFKKPTSSELVIQNNSSFEHFIKYADLLANKFIK